MTRSAGGAQPEITGFTLALSNFEGPFDLLINLIGSRKLDITEVALAEVTDEFIAYTRALDESSQLDEVTEFVYVAATLLDLKAARLLPRGQMSDAEGIELLESRDLLLARLLQYRAYQQVADLFGEWQREAPRRYARAVSLEPRFASLLPPVVLGHTPESFAQAAAAAFRPRAPEVVSTEHVHAAAVSVPEQAGKLLEALRTLGVNYPATFDALTRDCTRTIEVVGRFLALLELYKARAVEVDQDTALGPLHVAWTGRDVDPAVVAAANWN
ncbi:Segregation and condensation protein A [Corynebacterium capitovis DSM 44611]|uniref:segregation and condensation protein A n=1 Tax=Corynebacterium capitovis TaxID=131081 RepID=UPI00036ABA2E|nr:ScpA family protein [Corynebacterium capitovis]WKD57713.1 Segregation and condensation protein A [Corynebacterium capitovis DSM 44611]